MIDRPIEVTTKYVTSVETLPEAWAFVMERIDSAGPRPRILISPVSIFRVADIDSDTEPEHLFEVLVEGTTHEGGSDE